MAISKLLRISNWLKNIFVLSPLIYSMKMFDLLSIEKSIIAFFTFCFASSALYIINDIQDREEDKLHPRKKFRPIASGIISVPMALFVMLMLIALTIYGASLLSKEFVYVLILFSANNILYTYLFKKINLLESFSVATSFVFRTIAGCFAINAEPSVWIIVITFSIALFLVFIKRKSEIIMLGEHASDHRKVLEHYTPVMLDQFILICAAITVTGYILYSINEKVIAVFGTNLLVYSSIFVFLGVFRFMQISNSKSHEGEGDPTTLLLKDRFSQINALIYSAYIIAIIYLK